MLCCFCGGLKVKVVLVVFCSLGFFLLVEGDNVWHCIFVQLQGGVCDSTTITIRTHCNIKLFAIKAYYHVLEEYFQVLISVDSPSSFLRLFLWL